MIDTTHPDPAHAPLQDDTPRKGATPLLWVLLAVAIVALGWWYFAHRSAGFEQAAPVEVGAIPVITGQQPVAAASREAARRRTATAAARTRAPAAAVAPASHNAELLAHAQPDYPVDARRRGVEGTVMLRIAVDARGVPTDVGYADRSGDAALDRAAMIAARDWRFHPATRNGQAVASTVEVPVRFILPQQRG